MSRFPRAVQDFARGFVHTQGYRHEADYDPEANFTREEVLQIVNEARGRITLFNEVDGKDRRAFAAYVMFTLR